MSSVQSPRHSDGRVRSIIGRISNSRMFHFAAGHADPAPGEFYIGWVDRMRSNLSSRIEVVVPVDGEGPETVGTHQVLMDLARSRAQDARVNGKEQRFSPLRSTS